MPSSSSTPLTRRPVHLAKHAHGAALNTLCKWCQVHARPALQDAELFAAIQRLEAHAVAVATALTFFSYLQTGSSPCLPLSSELLFAGCLDRNTSVTQQQNWDRHHVATVPTSTLSNHIRRTLQLTVAWLRSGHMQ